ncbi:hypothetical protein [Natrarchaeobius oligotrophus]|uniref:Uncharacterized protein n=1 Tax=Natrarchaeobius chitinivorans TaxID=1679083 RepID=A0A3N6M648_NATCH|nr:hypothetical protein [Natrarchaeobius chitinivorans]RQG97617.1 hypothetical protein EA472_18945 [Natrarchaeobius chitinivorans]
MTVPSNATRRQLLAGLATAGGVSLAGCSEISLSEDDSGRFERSELEAILTVPTPDVDPPVPIGPADAALENELERVSKLLDAVPPSVERDDVPNGVVRETIEERRVDATEYRESARETAGSARYHALRNDVPDAREAARESATTLAAVEDGPAVDELDDERGERRSRLDDRLETTAYAGDDSRDGRLRAALVAADREDDLVRAGWRVRRWRLHAGSNVVELGEHAGDLEFVAATTDAWDHLSERYADDLRSSVDLEAAFSAALERSIDAATEFSLPDQDEDDWLSELVEGDLETGFQQTLVWDAVRPVYDARDRMDDAASEGRLGRGLAAAVRFEQERRAFETVRDRFEGRDVEPSASIDEIRSEREAAIEAVESALESFAEPTLAAARLADGVRALGWTDDRIRRWHESDSDALVSLSDEYSGYVCLRARFDALPDAAEATRTRLFEE